MSSPTTARRLTRNDLDAVVAIDAALVGQPRGEFFQRRLASALAVPELHAQFGVDAADGSGLAGFVLARVLAGEFGRPDPALRLQAIGVRKDVQGQGVGRALMEALEAAARKFGATVLRTTAAWNDHQMLAFLDHEGFTLADNQVIDCKVHMGRLTPPSESDDDDDDGDTLERDLADVRTLTRDDLPAIVRIDAKLTGRERSDYIRRKVEDALGDSDIAISLVAREDNHAIGFLTARVDLGDSGRTAPVAVIDTIGVDPGYAKQGVGSALLSQLFGNLSSLRVERIETIISRSDFALLGFLYRVGFAPSQRLAFLKRLA